MFINPPVVVNAASVDTLAEEATVTLTLSAVKLLPFICTVVVVVAFVIELLNVLVANPSVALKNFAVKFVSPVVGKNEFPLVLETFPSLFTGRLVVASVDMLVEGPVVILMASVGDVMLSVVEKVDVFEGDGIGPSVVKAVLALAPNVEFSKIPDRGDVKGMVGANPVVVTDGGVVKNDWLMIAGVGGAVVVIGAAGSGKDITPVQNTEYVLTIFALK